MKELKDYTKDELMNELRQREIKEFEESNKQLPKKYYPYIDVDRIEKREKSQYFYAHVDDGSEGFDYLIQADYQNINGTDDEDKSLENTIRHSIITEFNEHNSEIYIEEIRVGELGRYDMDFLKITLPKNIDEDDE